jgi:hypothetical protein
MPIRGHVVVALRLAAARAKRVRWEMTGLDDEVRALGLITRR